MMLSPNRAVLFRPELIVHHLVAFVSYSTLITMVPLIGSRLLVGEYLSCLNACLSVTYLTYYRIFVMCAIRIPTWAYFLSYYHPCFLGLYVSTDDAQTLQIVKWVAYPSYVFAIVHDVYILRKCVNSTTRPRV